MSTVTTLRAVLGALGPTLDDAHATVVVDRPPVVMAEPTQLAQVFQNLISNAVSSPRPAPPRGSRSLRSAPAGSAGSP